MADIFQGGRGAFREGCMSVWNGSVYVSTYLVFDFLSKNDIIFEINCLDA